MLTTLQIRSWSVPSAIPHSGLLIMSPILRAHFVKRESDWRCTRLSEQKSKMQQTQFRKYVSHHSTRFFWIVTDKRDFNLLFSTHAGTAVDHTSLLYLRPETAQGIFISFANLCSVLRKTLPFGVASYCCAVLIQLLRRRPSWSFLPKWNITTWVPISITWIRADGIGILLSSRRSRSMVSISCLTVRLTDLIGFCIGVSSVMTFVCL